MDYLVKYLADERAESVEIPEYYREKRNLMRILMNIRMPLEISSEFLKVQDEFLTAENFNKELTAPEDITQTSGKISLWQGDITTLKVDAIVNAANNRMLGCFQPMHNCIDNVIHSAAGIQLRLECNRIMQGATEEVGKAKITNAYNLPSKHVIHTVGPALMQGQKADRQDKIKLANCYSSCLELAAANKLDSIAFCCISTGVFNFPKDDAAKIAIETVKKFLDENETSLNHVIFNVFTDEDYFIYNKLLF